MTLFAAENQQHMLIRLSLRIFLSSAQQNDHRVMALLTNIHAIIKNASLLHFNSQQRTIDHLEPAYFRDGDAISLALSMIDNPNLILAINQISTVSDLLEQQKVERLLKAIEAGSIS